MSVFVVPAIIFSVDGVKSTFTFSSLELAYCTNATLAVFCNPVVCFVVLFTVNTDPACNCNGSSVTVDFEEFCKNKSIA